ncbi:ABC transporter substrate-binding protein [Helicovermis profundi]|uniref:ABC transporter substrate-binding protein n=1 Tax=Helicovermis profundi TaxID=3065157 RepID=A0AAU9EB44_9FIRM|nr:hypothetical protein HLPR_08500 [Clostridia bacterium S502]
MKKLLIGVLIVVLLGLTGCTSKVDNNQIDSSVTKVRSIKIAEQYGLAYAPLIILKEKNFIKNYDENLTLEWVKLANTTAIRESMISDNLDIGFMGIPPFLIGSDNGMKWKIFTGLSSSPLGLVTSDNRIKNLRDISKSDKIALPQPGSIQHILLSMAAKREFNDAKYFDKQLVSMKHPDGMTALVSGSDIKLHFTSPPYLFMEQNEGLNTILTGDEAFGDEFTFIVGAVNKNALVNKKDDIEILKKALNDVFEFIDNNRNETLEILSKSYNIDREDLEDYLYNRNMIYGDSVKGLDTFIKFLKENDYISDKIEIEDVVYGM